MPLLLRTVRQNRWFKDEAAPYLAVDDVPSDPIGDLGTQQNKLSVWELFADRSNLERVVRAVALGRNEIADMGYVLFDSALLPELAIESIKNPGKTPDKGANPWHRDLVVSGRRLVGLTKAILQHGESGTILKLRLRQLVEEGIQSKQISEKFRNKIS